MARDLRGTDVIVLQGVHYEDPDQGASREIDVIAARMMQLVNVAHLAAYLVIECKYSKDRPWVLFRDKPHATGTTPDFDRITTDYGGQWLNFARYVPAISEAPLFQQELRAGYALGTVTFAKDGPPEPTNDLAWKALQSATKAARWWAANPNMGTQFLAETFGVVFPVVVVQGRLFEAWLDGDRIAAKEMDCRSGLVDQPGRSAPGARGRAHRGCGAGLRTKVPGDRRGSPTMGRKLRSRSTHQASISALQALFTGGPRLVLLSPSGYHGRTDKIDVLLTGHVVRGALRVDHGEHVGPEPQRHRPADHRPGARRSRVRTVGPHRLHHRRPA